MANFDGFIARMGVARLGIAALLLCVPAMAVFAATAPIPVTLSSPKPGSDASAKVKTPAGRAQFVQQHCTACHNARAKTGGLVLDGIAADPVPGHADIWEKVVKRLGAGEMPPHTVTRRPDPALAQAMVAGLVQNLDAAAKASPYAGRTVIRRLNRTEYANAVRDLLHLDFPYTDELPQDTVAGGFDNIGDALSMSPLLLETYLKVARRVSDLALGEGDASVVTERFAVTKSQAVWQGEGMPFETRGGVRARMYFPRDGEYELRAFLNDVDLTPTEGVRFFHLRVPVKAGDHTFIVTFPDRHAAQEGPVPNLDGAGGAGLGGPVDAKGSSVRPSLMFLLDGKKLKEFEIAGPTAGEAVSIEAGPPTLARAEVTGPYHAGAAQTESRRAILTCRPKAQEKACAQKILTSLLRRAWRRDVTAAEAAPYLASFTKARGSREFAGAISIALRDILVSPDFLFRLEFDPKGTGPGQVYRVQDFELASRLSFFLWSSIPDERLLKLAAGNQLHDPQVLDREARRMLADPKADALMDNFANQWLALDEAETALPDAKTYPEFNVALRDAFRTETRLFLRSILRENRSIIDIVDANYTYLNDRLAELYGIPGVTGPAFRKVQLAGNSPRGGITGMGSVLMLTSHANKTSPILRGKWVLTNLLDSPPNPPPAGVPPLNVAPDKNGRVLTTREQIERHRAQPLCATCHSRMDPLGFALENFDVIGRWRDKDEGGKIDASAVTAGGVAISGPNGLKQALASRPEIFVTAATTRLMTYALGRTVEAQDMPQVRAIVRKAGPAWKFQDIVLGVIQSTPFRMKQAAKDQT
jgi:mono/diheme cytochrome c family protein